MADKAMNEFNTGSSIKYVYAEDASGNQVRASMATMGKTLWGQNQANVTTQDWDTLTTPGLYAVSNATGANKPNSYNYGLLEVCSAGSIIIQTHGGHPCLRLYTSRYRACYGLAPVRVCSCWANKEKTMADNLTAMAFLNPRSVQLYASCTVTVMP